MKRTDLYNTVKDYKIGPSSTFTDTSIENSINMLCTSVVLSE